MARFGRVSMLVVSGLAVSAAGLLLAQQAPPAPSAAFQTETDLVLVPFNVVRGAYFAPDVKADDVVLLEDGKPRSFSAFEGRGTGRRPPLELVLLFDTTTLPPPESKIVVPATHWDRKATYDFTKHWGDAESRAVLEKGGADVRVSVYRYDHQQMQRLCRSASDPQTLTNAIHRLPDPMSGDDAIPLTLPPNRKTIEAAVAENGRSFPRKPTDPVLWPLSWTAEATIAALKDSAAAPSNAIRALAVFSEALGTTTTTAEDVAGQANALGVPVYPVVLDFDEYLRHPFAIGITKGSGAPTPGAIPIDRPEWSQGDPAAATGPVVNPASAEQSGAPVRRYDPAPDTPGEAFRRAPTVGNLSTIPMVRFGSLGDLTDGHAFYPSRIDAATVTDILDTIRDKGLSQYVVGFAPGASGPQREHRLEIRLKSKSSGKVVGGKRAAVY